MKRGAPILPALMLPVLALLAACGDRGGGEEDAAVADAAPEPVPAMTSPAADGGLQLQALGDTLEVDLGPTLGGCSFEHEGEVLLIAGAPDDRTARGRGVVQIAGAEHLLTGQSTGGPEYMNSGPTMSDGDYTVEVRRAEGEGEKAGIESTRWPADLVVRGGAAGERIYRPGTWTCGV